jgi:hypothetical protein
MQLQRMLCCTYSMIFATQLSKSRINYIEPQGQLSPPPPPQGKILGAHLTCALVAVICTVLLFYHYILLVFAVHLQYLHFCLHFFANTLTVTSMCCTWISLHFCCLDCIVNTSRLYTTCTSVALVVCFG